MDWNIGWLFWGAAAFLLVIINLIRTFLGKRRGWQVLLFASLSCGALTVLEEYRMVARWLQWGDLAAVQDVVPTMAGTLQTAVWIGVLLNLAVLALNLRKERDADSRNTGSDKKFAAAEKFFEKS